MCITYAIVRARQRKNEQKKAEEAIEVQQKIQAQLGPRPLTPQPSATQQQHNVTAPLPHGYSPRHSTSPLSPDNTHFASPTGHQSSGQQPAELESPVSPVTVGNRQSMGPPPMRHPQHHANGYAQVQGQCDSHRNPHDPDSFGRPPNPMLGEAPPSYTYSERTASRTNRQSERRG